MGFLLPAYPFGSKVKCILNGVDGLFEFDKFTTHLQSIFSLLSATAIAISLPGDGTHWGLSLYTLNHTR